MIGIVVGFRIVEGVNKAAASLSVYKTSLLPLTNNIFVSMQPTSNIKVNRNHAEPVY